MNELLRLPFVLRGTLTPLLPEQAFLRRDRTDALFVTNAPLFADADVLSAALSDAGFNCRHSGTLLFLIPDASLLRAVEGRYPPPDFFCASLERFRLHRPCAEAVNLFARGVRLLEHSDPAGLSAYSADVRRLAAVCLRKNLGGVYGCALVDHVLNHRKEYEP